MTPEKTMELELKKLEIEQQLEVYRINKETEAATKRAASMQDAIKMVGSALEGIGKSVADSLISQKPGFIPSADVPPPQPSNMIDDSMMQSPADAGEEANVLGGKLECPDCNQEAVYVTSKMYDAGQRGETVEAACVACGAKHVLGDPEPEDSMDDNGAIPPVAFSPPITEHGRTPANPARRPANKGMHDEGQPGAIGRNGKVRPPRRNFTSVY